MGDVNDPFYLVKDEIQATVDKVRGVLERMERLPEGNSERQRYASQITSECESVQWQLEELDRATAMAEQDFMSCLLYTSPSPRDATLSRMPSSA